MSKQSGPKKRAYTDETREKALAVLAVEGNLSKVSRKLGIPKGTLHAWKQAMGGDQFAEQRADRRARLIDAIWDAATEVVDEIRKKVKDETDLHKVVGAFAQLAAKGALLSQERKEPAAAQASVNVSIQNQPGGHEPSPLVRRLMERGLFESADAGKQVDPGGT